MLLLGMRPVLRLIEAAQKEYVFGLFRHFSKFDNHDKSPFECDSPIDLLSAVASPTCAESLVFVNSPLMIEQSACDVREINRTGARGPTGSRVSARSSGHVSIYPFNSMNYGPLSSYSGVAAMARS
jgi:hypothetical protein